MAICNLYTRQYLVNAK